MNKMKPLHNKLNIFALQTNPDLVAWQPFREGVEIFPIYQSSDSELSSALLRYQPGASVPLHQHAGCEHILVISGQQSDEDGNYEVGDLLVSSPKTAHSISSEQGCIVFAVWEKPVQFLSLEISE